VTYSTQNTAIATRLQPIHYVLTTDTLMLTSTIILTMIHKLKITRHNTTKLICDLTMQYTACV